MYVESSYTFEKYQKPSHRPVYHVISGILQTLITFVKMCPVDKRPKLEERLTTSKHLCNYRLINHLNVGSAQQVPICYFQNFVKLTQLHNFFIKWMVITACLKSFCILLFFFIYFISSQSEGMLDFLSFIFKSNWFPRAFSSCLFVLMVWKSRLTEQWSVVQSFSQC